MRRKTAIIRLLLLVITVTTGAGEAAAVDTVRVEVLRDGRKIMRDGFLMEWSLKTASVWGSDSTWRYDAMATAEGLAGYVQLLVPDGCREGELLITADATASERIALPPDTLLHGRFWRADRSMFATDSTYTIEWLVPWPRDRDFLTSPFSVILEERCSGQPVLPVLRLTYRHHEKKSGHTGGLIGRILLIGILGGIYLTVRVKIRNRSRRTEFPHQSA